MGNEWAGRCARDNIKMGDHCNSCPAINICADIQYEHVITDKSKNDLSDFEY